MKNRRVQCKMDRLQGWPRAASRRNALCGASSGYGKRVGSGGATFHVLKYIAEKEGRKRAANLFKNRRILVIHSGRQKGSSILGLRQALAPGLGQLPGGYASTLFDEFIIGMSGVPSRIPKECWFYPGMCFCFNPLQIDFNYHGAAAISMKENVLTGRIMAFSWMMAMTMSVNSCTSKRRTSAGLGAVNGQDNGSGYRSRDNGLDLLYALLWPYQYRRPFWWW